MKTKITMNQSKKLSVESAYELFIRKCRVKNLSEATITSYNNKVIPFVEFCNGGEISAVTIDTVDGFTDMLKKEHNVNDVSVGMNCAVTTRTSNKKEKMLGRTRRRNFANRTGSSVMMCRRA